MPRLKNVTRAEIQSVQNAMDDIIHLIFDLTERMDKGYCDELADPITILRDFSNMSRAASGMIAPLLMKNAMQEQKAEIEALLLKRLAQEKEINRALEGDT